MKTPGIKKATKDYEAWLGERTTLVQADLEAKHQMMAQGAFAFLRGTFYRWSQTWPQVCAHLTQTPPVLAVGDLHVENFGTWRDSDGRLVWGVNDFDEAYSMPYANDLVRLATSAILAVQENHLSLKPEEVCGAVLAGYQEGLAAGGRAFVLAEHHAWLRQIARGALSDPVTFWQKMDKLAEVKEGVPASAREAMESLLPDPQPEYRVVHRRAGVGSLGHQRFVAVADWCGGEIAREAKALVPSAYLWAIGEDKGPIEILYQAIITQARRACDPFVQLRGMWIVRRLAPDCSRVALESLPAERDEARLLHAMGWETANIHLGSRETVGAVRRNLERQPKDWLRKAAEKMAQATQADWEAWK
ncbi:MAG: DUF2252 family protein [Armatimonadetes bacterium]|nr:DUF2252 family protein [Armatimonadota bacterium]